MATTLRDIDRLVEESSSVAVAALVEPSPRRRKRKRRGKKSSRKPFTPLPTVFEDQAEDINGLIAALKMSKREKRISGSPERVIYC